MRNLSEKTKAELLNEVNVLEQHVASLEFQIDELEQKVSSQQESFSFLQAILENLPFEVWACDTEGRYTYQNAQDIAYWGVNIGKTIDELTNWSKETLDQWKEGNQRAFSGETVREEDERVIKQEKRHFSTFVGPIHKDDTLLGIVGVNIDTTEHVQAENALRASEDKFSKAFHTSPDSININRLEDGIFIDINDGFTKVTGYKKEDVIGKTSLEIDIWANPEDRIALTDALRARGEVANLEATFRMNDGKERVGLISACIIEVNGEQCILSIARDISGRKQMEQELRESEERYRLLVESSPTGIVLHRDEKIFYANQAATKLLGASEAEEIIGRNIIDFVHPDYRQIVLKRARLARKQYQAAPLLEEKFLRLDGSSINVEVAGVPFLSQGKPSVQVIINDITERKLADEKLRENEEKFRSLVENALAGIFTVDDKYHFIYANEELCRILGYSEEQLLGMDFRDVLSDDSRDLVAERYTRRQRGEDVPPRYELSIIRSDGELRHAEMSVTVVKDKDENLFSMGQLVDITERKRADEALRESEFFLRKSQAVASLGSYYFDARTGTWISSQALDNIFGIDDDFSKDIDGWIGLIHPDERDEMFHYFNQYVLAEHNRFDKEYRIIRHDNQQERWMHGLGELETDESGNTIKMIGTIQDITERKQVEEALKEKTDELGRFFTVALDLLCIAGTDGYFHRLNPQWEAVLGYELSELEKKRFLDLVHPDDLADTLAAFGQLNAQKVVLDFVNRYRCKDGSYRWIEWRSYPIGNLIYAAARDITERKQAEEALRVSEERLKQIIRVSRIGIFDHDSITDNIYMSPEYRKIREWGPDENVTLPMLIEQIHPDDRKLFEESILRAHDPAGDGYYNIEYRIVCHDGTLRWIVARSQTIFEGEGASRHPIRTIGAVLDVTESRQTEEALHLTRFTVESVADAVYWIDSDARIVDVNEAACRMLDYERGELIGMTLQDIDPDFPASQWSDTWKRLKKMGKLVRETQHKTRDGRLFPVEIIANYIDFGGHELDCAVVRDITERKMAEEALRESQQMLRLVLDTIPVRVFWKDTTLHYLGCNRSFALDAGLSSPEKILGKNDFELVWKSQAEMYRADDQTVVETGLPKFNYEEPQTTPMGNTIWLRTSKVPLIDASGRIRGLLGTYEDISERRRAEEEISSLARFPKENPSPVLRLDSSGVVLFANPASEPILKSWGCAVGQRVPEQWYKVTNDVLTRHVGQTLDIDCDGRIFSLIAAPIASMNYVNLYAQDITERKQAEEALRENEARYRAVIESQVDLISRYLPDTTLTFVNDAYCQFYGRTREELIGQSYLFMITPEFREAVRKETENLANGSMSLVGEYLNYRYDGEERWIQWSVQCISDEDGRVVELQAVGRDVTDLKLAKEEIIRLNEELEQRVVERTTQLESANKELEAFSYSVSHDLRAPLRAIDGFSRILIEDYAQDLPDEMARLLGTVRSNTQEMGSLIDGLLKFSRLSRQPIDKQTISMSNLVRQVLEILQADMEERVIDIVTGELPTCQGDPVLLKQVWTNLLSNALKFTREREVARIEIGCNESESEQIYFVKDNGVGFDMQYASKLFGVFQRLHRADEFEGTGVGLATVQRIIHRHGGRVWTEAEPNIGATFYFSL